MAENLSTPLDESSASQRPAPLTIPSASSTQSAAPRQRIPSIILIALAAALACLTYFAPVSNTGSDSRYTLLTSQAILQHGTIRLDTYYDKGRLPEDDARLVGAEGHLYHYFPLGTPLLSLPAVWIANLTGLDMADFDDDAVTQRVLASLLCAAALLLAYAICRCYVSRWSALVIATVLVFGSTLTSTMGTALWSIDFTVVLILLCLWLIARYDAGVAVSPQPALLGLLLFLAYLCRPPTALFIALIGLYLWRKDRRALVQCLLVFCFPLSLFVALSVTLYGLPLPPYYLPERLGSLPGLLASASTAENPATPIAVTLYGLIFSPGRGLFVYSPMLLIVLIATLYTGAARRLSALAMLVWLALHVVVLLRFPIWWGGHSFGPRLFTDALPAFILLAPMAWLRLAGRRRLAFLAAAAFLLTGAFAIAVHSYAGLYNLQTHYWNGGIMPPELALPQLFDWRYPQFAASAAGNCARNAEYMEGVLRSRRAALTPYFPGDDIDANDASDADNFQPVAFDPHWQTSLLSFPWQRSSAQESAEALAEAGQLYLPLVANRSRVTGPLILSALFVGWSAPTERDETITSLCESASILLGPLPQETLHGSATVTLELSTPTAQEIEARINGESVAAFRLEATPDGATELVRLPFDAALLAYTGVNRITLDVMRDPEDAFARGVRFRSLLIDIPAIETPE